ncbi:MAG: sigma-70 family RNA polymerase sigma factor [Isosphaeraceae bacterium]|nr:sigma-70 family RNA polymerase sigma factor [Isosphaeraceae bacterium]
MTKALDEIRRVFTVGTLAGLSDGQLVERFAAQGDGEAFAAIVARHGAMVLSVCRSALGSRDASDAEDAFQATFLVLVRRAGSFPLNGSLAGWLYRVARRVARQARIEASRRRTRERAAAGRREDGRPHDPARDELCRLVHQELAHLPERYRMPILLCDLNGLTRDQAAEAIGCPPGTIAGRLARGREQLRDRLARRGAHPSSAWPAVMAMSIEDVLGLFERATCAAVLAAGGEGGTKTVASLLAARASRSLVAARASGALVLLIALGAAGVATVVLGFRTDGGPRDDRPPAPAAGTAPAPQARAEPRAPLDPDDPATADLFAGKVVDADGRPLDGVKIYIAPHSALAGSPGSTIPGGVRAVTAAGGLFRFSAKDLTFMSLDGLPARRPGLLVADAEGYGPDWVQTWGQTGSSFVSHLDPVKGAELALTLPRDDVPIRGRLLGPDSRPLVGAAVRLTGLDVPWKKDLNAHLERQRSPNALLMMTDYDRSLDTPGALPGVATETVTDADGRFRFEGLGRERLARLTIRGPGIAETSIVVMTRESAPVRARPLGASEDYVTYGASFTLALERGRTVSGVVRDKATGAPLPDVWVGPGLRAIAALETGRYPDATDARGRFALAGLSSDLKELHYAEMTASGQFRSEQVVLAVPKPGQPYFLAKGRVNDAGEVVVDCPRGIPFRLTLRDEAGRPVEAEVTYSVIAPNEFFLKEVEYVQAQAGSPLSRAARQADGSYLGVALPGPGVVLAKTPRQTGYRPSHVDPKAFFAPGKVDWTPQELITTYGSHDTLSVATFYGGAWLDQHDYAAIVLINPARGAAPLELAATVMPDKPRQVTLLDPEGRPVRGVKTAGLTYHPWDDEPALRAATIPITGLHPDRARRINFVKEDRKLIGFLLARGDGDAPYTVRMRPWATVTGRVVDEQGKPRAGASLAANPVREFATHDDSGTGVFTGVSTDEHGRFRAERLIPGQSYSATLYLGIGRPGGPAFEGLKLAPGEVRDLGDLRLSTPADADRKARIDPKTGQAARAAFQCALPVPYLCLGFDRSRE